MAAEEEKPIPTEVTARVTPSFGKYRPLERLGGGGMADVFLALATGAFDAKKLVVLKQPRSLSGETVQMFLDEARLAMRLNHPNVVQTYDVGVQDGVFFLAMEYLEGQPLHRILARMVDRDEAIEDQHLARIASDALAGLHYAHELADFDGTPLEIVHRDVSPHNVFVTYDGTVKVVDFGIAKATSNVVSTESGVLKGKVAYMAPEHASSGVVDRRTDVFSMGVVLWEMVARKRLFTAETPAQLLNVVLTTDAPKLSRAVPDVDPQLESIVMRALQRDPDKRWPTALAMREALDAYVDVSGERPRDDDFGELVATLFADERTSMQHKVRAHARSAQSRPSLPDDSKPSIPRSSAHDLDARESTASGVRTGMPVVTSTTPSLDGSPRTKKRPPLGLAALAISVVSLAIALFVVVKNGQTPAPDPKPAASTAAPPPPAAPPTVTASVTTALEPPSASASASASAIVGMPTPSARPPSTANPRPTTTGVVRPIDTSFPR